MHPADLPFYEVVAGALGARRVEGDLGEVDVRTTVSRDHREDLGGLDGGAVLGVQGADLCEEVAPRLVLALAVDIALVRPVLGHVGVQEGQTGVVSHRVKRGLNHPAIDPYS